MTRGMGGHSVSNVTHHLKGIHFPAGKQALLRQARQNGAAQDGLSPCRRWIGPAIGVEPQRQRHLDRGRLHPLAATQ